MKPSPENTSPISRLNARRQLDLCSDLSNYSSVVDLGTRALDACNDRLPGNVAAVDSRYAKEAESLIRNVQARELTTRNSVATAGDNRLAQTGTPQSTSVAQAVLDPYSQCNIGLPAMQYSSSCSQLTPTCQQAINAFESRRISNQLARAQFLASTPASTNQGHNTYVRQILRARSVSPQNPATQNVTRSPSAPTLETAL